MTSISITTASLRALINVYKASLGIKQTLLLGAVGVTDDGEEIWEDFLDWPDLGICYFNLRNALDQAQPEILRLEAIDAISEGRSFSLKLDVEIERQKNDDLKKALEEIAIMQAAINFRLSTTSDSSNEDI